METSNNYKLAKRLQRAANEPLIMRTALAQMSEAERGALTALLARYDMNKRRIAEQRRAERTQRQAAPPVEPEQPADVEPPATVEQAGPIIVNDKATAQAVTQQLKERRATKSAA